mmetsp:Transcript_2357/g.4392  ORF Transcript_2357/g.4392 Transcript_2357/m.4392 type:complete len:638 (+) Transcript_2357:666-2579(+)
MTMNDFKQGMGFHTMWGLSPSFDLLLYQTTVAATDTATSVAGTVAAKQEEINILLVHPGDARHVVHTLGRHGCRCRRQQQQQQQHVNIFILESEIEILARHILQMKIFLDDYIPIRHRASLYLELYNGLISERGYDYVNQAGKDLGEFVYGDDVIGNGNGGDDDELSRLRHLVDLSWLKQKERDALYHVFQNEWCGSGIVSGSGVSSVNTGGSLSDTGGNGRSKLHHDKLQEVNVELLRDYRLRGYYGDRYDCRHNLSEYDYYTRVKQTAGIIHVDQWRKWRMTGIAYEFGSNNVMYDKQNRTMMTSINKSGIINQNVKGYWLDIINGPYISHGVEIDDDDLTAVLDATHDNTTKNIYARGLLEVLNQGTGAEQYRHHTVEVSMFNLMDYMWGFETGTKYIMTKEHDIFSGLDTSSCHSNGRAMATTTTAKAQLASQNNQEQHRKESCNDCHDEAHVNTKENMKRMTPISVTKSQRKLGLHGITIIPLLGDLDNVLSKKKKYQGRFDYVFLSQRVAHWLGSDKFKSILRLHCIIPDDNNNNNNNNQEQDTTNAPTTTTSSSFLDGNARVEVESGKFIFQLQEKDQIALYKRIKTMAEMQGFDEIPLSSRKSSNSSSNTNTIKNDVPWNKNTFLFQAR